MQTDLKDLKESNEFLNLLLDNINAAVLIADENFRIFQVNNFFLELFDSAAETVVDKRFGGVSGCVHAVRENLPCGETSACKDCALRQSVMQTLLEKVPVDRVWLNRVFYINNRPMEKYMQFSTRFIKFNGQKMILVLIYDVTDLELQKIELQKKQTQIDIDLAAAAEIQKNLLPEKVPVSERIKMAWKFEPSGKIGGDIFNIHYPEKDKIGLYMLDVCGHGVSAALIAVAVSQFFTSQKNLLGEKSKIQPPEKVLYKLNNAFPFERFDSFFTIIYMTIDNATGLLTYSCAGHPPPFLIRTDNRLEILEKHGPVIGAEKNRVYGQYQKQLYPGDKIVLYTDGILELCSKDGEFFGKKRFYRLFEKYGQKSPKRLIETVYLKAKAYCDGKDIDDDISILVVEYTG
ncbi:MAG: SpoIIE family protein phosphatase [Desulfobacterales bacterium]